MYKTFEVILEWRLRGYGLFLGSSRDILLRQRIQTGSGIHPDKGTSSSVKGPRRLAG